MPFPADRPVHILEQEAPALPLPPLNFSVQSAYERGAVDLRWDPPTNLVQNSRFSVLGVNLYRSHDSEFGPFFRLNEIPVGSTYWRDSERIAVALQEDVSRAFTARGPTDPDGQWAFRTARSPVVIQPWLGAMDLASLNVHVTVNGARATVAKIVAQTGEVWLANWPTFDAASQAMAPPVLPSSPTDVVLATYRYVENEVPAHLAQKTFYLATTVARDEGTGELIETPLDRGAAADNQSTERLDWVWREAVRRNKFLLYQGGERVKVLIHKVVGPRCGCVSDLHRQPQADCATCWGQGVIGGFDGPFDLIVAPEDAALAVTQGNRGRTVSQDVETWTGPAPMLSQRDLIVKLNGDRYAVGPVRSPTARGMRLQQHFTMSHIDEKDARARVPVIDTSVMVSPQTRYIVPGRGDATPMVTERAAIPDGREIRGHTVSYENQTRR